MKDDVVVRHKRWASLAVLGFLGIVGAAACGNITALGTDGGTSSDGGDAGPAVDGGDAGPTPDGGDAGTSTDGGDGGPSADGGDAGPVAVVPGAPTAVVATVAAKSSLAVAFSPPADAGSSPITSYTVNCASSNAGVAGGDAGAASPVTVVGLTPAKTYTCTVAATNGAGTGPASAPSTAVLLGCASGTTAVALGDAKPSNLCKVCSLTNKAVGWAADKVNPVCTAFDWEHWPILDAGRALSEFTCSKLDQAVDCASTACNDGEIVYDSATDLTWQRCSLGSIAPWADAGTYCGTLSYGGYTSGWRLPSVAELLTITDFTVTSPGLAPAFPVPTTTTFWSSVPAATVRTPPQSWYVGTYQPTAGLNDQTVPTGTPHAFEFTVRCVR
jgi:hypothetical protein